MGRKPKKDAIDLLDLLWDQIEKGENVNTFDHSDLRDSVSKLVFDKLILSNSLTFFYEMVIMIISLNCI